MKIRKIAAICVLVLSSFAANNVAPSKAELEAMYDKAFREFDANNFPEALKQLDAIDARQPDLAESQNLRGVIFMREGIYDKAEAALQEALRIDPKFWNARFNLAEIPFLKKDWADARNRFQELLSNNSSDLQGEAAQLIQYKILLTYLMEGKENMVDSILAKFELSPDTPAVHYANAAIALQRKNTKEAKDWMAVAEKNFSPQLNKLFAESLYEVGWLQKQAGQSRAALEITTPQERAAKLKAFARSRFEQAQQAFQQRDLDTARKFIEEADATDPNQAPILTLKGEVLMEQKDFDGAEAAFKKAAKVDPKYREAQYNLAQIPFKKKDYTKARERFEALFSQTPGGDKNQAAQMIKFKIFMTLLLEGKDSKAQKMMEQFQFTGDTPALYYAQAAWEFKHNNPVKGNDWIASAKKIYSASLNGVFADSFYDLGWLQSPAAGGSPGPATEAAVVASAQTESSPAIEPSPIPDIAGKGGKAKPESTLALTSPIPSPATGADILAPSTNDIALNAPAASTTTSHETVAAGSPSKPSEIPASALPSLSPTVETPVAATSPSASLVASAASPSSAEQNLPKASATAPLTDRTAASPAAETEPVIARASATPATALAPSRISEPSRSSFSEKVGPFTPVLFVGGIILGLIAIFVFMPGIRRQLANVQMYRGPLPATGPRFGNGNGNRNGNGNGSMGPNGDAKTRLVGGPRHVSLQLKASEPSLRRSVRPVGKTARPGIVPAPVAPAPEPATESAMPIAAEPETKADVIERESEPVTATPEPAFAFAAAEPIVESVGPVIEAVGPVVDQEISPPVVEGAAVVAEPMPVTEAPELEIAPEPEFSPEPEISSETEIVEEPEISPLTDWEPTRHLNGESAPPADVEEAPLTSESSDVTPTEDMPLTEFEPVMQGQPVPYQLPVSMIDTAADEEIVAAETTSPVAEAASPITETVEPAAVVSDTPAPEVVDRGESIIEIPDSIPSGIVVSEPSIIQPTTPEIMPEPIQIPTAPVIRTSTAGGSPQPASAMQTAVQLTFSFEIASMQLTPTFKMGALQLRPTSRIVTMRLAPSQQPQPAMNLQVTFEISKIQPAGGGLGTVRLTPSQQQRPNISGSPSFTVGGLQLISNFEAAPVQLTPSQQASVLVTSSFQIATVEFSPTFDISSLVLNAASKQVAVQLAGAGSIESAPMFEIANLQLGASGDIAIMQLNLLGQGARRAV